MTETPLESAPAEEAAPKGFSWGKLLAWVLVLTLLTLVALQLRTTQLGRVSAGQVAPNFTLTTFFDGQEIGAEQLRGKIVLVNFWASWCKPCELEAADLQTAWETYAPRGDVIFLGIDYVDTATEAMTYLQRFGITYPNGPDLGTRISQEFHITGVPETFLIDREGMLVYTKVGPFTALSQITSQIDRLLEP